MKTTKNRTLAAITAIIAVIVFSFAACDNDTPESPPPYDTDVKYDNDNYNYIFGNFLYDWDRDTTGVRINMLKISENVPTIIQ